jgi:hypothetical protein
MVSAPKIAFLPARIASPAVTLPKTSERITLPGSKIWPSISTKRGICAEPPVRTTASITQVKHDDVLWFIHRQFVEQGRGHRLQLERDLAKASHFGCAPQPVFCSLITGFSDAIDKADWPAQHDPFDRLAGLSLDPLADLPQVDGDQVFQLS